MVGCSTPPPRKLEVANNTVVSTVPVSLTTLVEIPEPPNKEEYRVANTDVKEVMLVTYIGKLIATIGDANLQLLKIRKQQDEAKKTLETKDK